MTTEIPAPVVVTPTSGVDGRVALATALHSAPGVYAVLVGSGMSSAAGVPTGWQIVQDLIRKIALAEGVSPEEVGGAPEVWWSKQNRPDPRYDTLLTALAPTDSSRQSLLRSYFETGVDGINHSRPTSGHHALATLAARGLVRVIITTNFDRLIERALDEAGVAPQVVSSLSALAGMTPLVHAQTTVIKLHGDYLSSGLRNSPEELVSYPDEQKAFLSRVIDEYGLMVVGWSAEYDTALVDAIEAAPTRRYPTYWTTFHGSISEPASRLIAERRACAIDTAGADEFIGDLVQKVQRLDQIARRRSRPTLLRSYFFPPDWSNAPSGWDYLPLLQLRTVAAVGPATQDTCGFLLAENREALIGALRVAPLTQRLKSMGDYPVAVAASELLTSGATPTAPALTDWEATPGGHQSTEYCTYRLGGNAAVGISALVAVRFPGYGVNGQVVFTADIALSLMHKRSLTEVAMILRDGLLLVTTTLPLALAGILPNDAVTTVAEIHLLASIQDGNPGGQVNRENDMFDRVDLSSLGTATRAINQAMGCSAQLSGSLTDREAAELVCDEIDYIAHANGFLDPRNGLQLLRQELGVAPNPSS